MIEPRFQAAGRFNGGVAPVQLDDQWWIVDTTGIFVAGPIVAVSMWDFENGLSRIIEESGQYFVDTGGNRIDPRFNGKDLVDDEQ